MALGARVKAERIARGMKQGDLIDATNGAISQANLSALESRDSATSEAAVAIADALGVSLRWLLTGEGRKDDTDWPFRRVTRARWDRCSDEDRGYVQAAVNKALDECEALLGGATHLPGNDAPPQDKAA